MDLRQRGEYTISTDRSRLNINLIHDFISNHSYWGKGRARPDPNLKESPDYWQA